MSKLLNACAGSGKAVPGGVALLTYAAAPTFALMAIWSTLGDRPDVLCSSGQDAFPLGGMAAMYALMSLFHATPWLQLVLGRKHSSMDRLQPN
jgi:hypothetical protein